MLRLLAFIVACESPKPLPPKKNMLLSSDARMVQMEQFRGYLSRPAGPSSKQAILVIADVLDETSRTTVQSHPNQTVLVIDASASVQSASSYLLGLTGIENIERICAKQDCSAFMANP